MPLAVKTKETDNAVFEGDDFINSSYAPIESEETFYPEFEKEFFKHLTKELQPIFKKNSVAHLGFMAIAESGLLNEYMKDDRVYRSNLSLKENFDLKEGSPKGGAYFQSPKKGTVGKVKVAVPSLDTAKDMSHIFNFAAMSAAEANAFVHELVHVGHQVLGSLQEQAREGISRSNIEGLQDPFLNKRVPDIYRTVLATDEKHPMIGENYLGKEKKANLVAKVPAFGNEKEALIYRLSSFHNQYQDTANRDLSALTESLAFLNTYDSIASNPENWKNNDKDVYKFQGQAFNNLSMQTDYHKDVGLNQFNIPVYNKFQRTTASPVPKSELESDLALAHKSGKPSDSYFHDKTLSDYTFASDKDYIKDLRKKNKLLNEVASDVITDLRYTKNQKYNKSSKSIDSFAYPSVWEKIKKRLPFNEGGRVKYAFGDEVSPPLSKPDELPRPIGVMPNWAYGKTQFNDLDVYKKIEPVLKIDPIAMLGWQSYTSGNLEMREVKEDVTSRRGAFQGARNQQRSVKWRQGKYPKKQHRGRDAMNAAMLEHEKLGSVIPRKFKSSQYVDKMFYTSRANKSVSKDTISLIHELRHAGLEFLTKRTGEERKIKVFSVRAFNKYDTKGESWNKGRTFEDEEGVFAILDRAMQKKFFPETKFTVGGNRIKAADIYDEHKSARKEIDKHVAKLNTLATQELNAIKNTSVSERLKQKSLGGDDKSTIKKVMDWIFSQKQPDNLDTQMKALKVG